jgi:hypothetical protein
MDITAALAPKSDQLDAIELVEPRTFTVDTGSQVGQRDGRAVVEIRLVDLDRVWRPSKGMLDVIAACWGLDSSKWAGHRVTLYNDREVKFGPDKVGGTRISHISEIDGPRNLQIRGAGSSGRKQMWHVEPLPAIVQRDWLTELADAGNDVDLLFGLGTAAKAAGASQQIRDTIRDAWNKAKEGQA